MRETFKTICKKLRGPNSAELARRANMANGIAKLAGRELPEETPREFVRRGRHGRKTAYAVKADALMGLVNKAEGVDVVWDRNPEFAIVRYPRGQVNLHIPIAVVLAPLMF